MGVVGGWTVGITCGFQVIVSGYGAFTTRHIPINQHGGPLDFYHHPIPIYVCLLRRGYEDFLIYH